MADRIAFTHARLEALMFTADPQYPKRDRIYRWDDKQPGLALCVTNTGAKVFYLVKKVNGRVERIRLGAFPDIGPDEARDAARVRLGQIAQGVNPADERRAQHGEQTLAELFKRYMTDYANVHKRTADDDQAQFDRHCNSIKDKRLSAIRRIDVQQLHTGVGKDAPYAANRLLALLSKVFSFAGDVGFVAANPCKGIKRFREQSREGFLDAEELKRFLKALDRHNDPLIADFFRLCLFTGARRSNVQSMAWSDVNLHRRIWTIPAEASKSGDAITVYLTDPAIHTLKRRWRARINGNPHVFPSYGSSRHLTEPKAAWKQILDRAKITNLRLHDLRRTAGSWLAMGGASLPIIGKALGHKSTQSTAVYSRLNLEPIAAAMEMAATAMLGTSRPKPVTAKTSTRAREGGVADTGRPSRRKHAQHQLGRRVNERRRRMRSESMSTSGVGRSTPCMMMSAEHVDYFVVVEVAARIITRSVHFA
jgi:integrase